jgi:hypothetical protein
MVLNYKDDYDNDDNDDDVDSHKDEDDDLYSWSRVDSYHIQLTSALSIILRKRQWTQYIFSSSVIWYRRTGNRVFLFFYAIQASVQKRDGNGVSFRVCNEVWYNCLAPMGTEVNSGIWDQIDTWYSCNESRYYFPNGCRLLGYSPLLEPHKDDFL